MTAYGYTLTNAAGADLRAIIRYTRKQWGAVKTRDYIAKLEEGMARLAACQEAFADNERSLLGDTVDALANPESLVLCQNHPELAPMA